MTIIKESIDRIERVYSAAFMGPPASKKLLIASEGYGECKVYTLPDYRRQTVLGNPGGTTDLCPHPFDDSIFFAIGNFVPVFQAEEAKLVYVKNGKDGLWRMEPIRTIPFLHRIDVFAKNGKLYFVGATLCGAKKDKDDWSEPGKILVGEIDETTFELKNVRTVLDGLYRNHGFLRTEFNGRESYLVSGDKGAWVIPVPENPGEDWPSDKLFDFAVSDMAVCDIDDDGMEEPAVITPFHGDTFTIYKQTGKEYREIYSRKIEFGHVLWGGKVNGIPSFILGYRQADRKLLLIRRGAGGNFREYTIDTDCGPSQIACIQGLNCFHILSANRKVGIVDGEVALYTIFGDGISRNAEL
jgi:hypothetical protein